MTEQLFQTNEEMQQALAKEITKHLSSAIRDRGRASLVLSGGSTPKRLFQILADCDLDWAKVWITLADDRWVDPDHKDSNEHLVNDNLLLNKARFATFIGLKTPADNPFDGANACHQKLQDIASQPFDVTLLGMGADGHTASLFPCAEELGKAVEGSNLVCQGVVPKTAPYQRMTLTLPVLLNSRALFLQIAGDDKKEVYKTACEPGDEAQMPIRYFIRQKRVPLQVYWAPKD
ncbi:6-phosphogluconolactonase [Pseudobacteriovorax antillogorgiicola]|uniref:6-phosphogluconolactonase n=1 Tax=Pseudobacteriovorax antillogorgiicola TaxID=1513793 RepID=A0A1Y6BJ96_9BACT|nr:6-phosphogluconolactonase [Pseudobacteriovorax antillogorgiicola]TCS55577.1 6-phosphogluconolactonase [Pseudobacteriovorax antillogorgiicola]SMF10676.1 6-phosphogluconolactonase [Pseudobacteriovorax antillogorgiicola]